MVIINNYSAPVLQHTKHQTFYFLYSNISSSLHYSTEFQSKVFGELWQRRPPKWNTKPVAEAAFTNMPTGYFLRLAGLFTQSPGNLGHRGHTCTVSETELELHTGTNQPQRPTPEYDPRGRAGLARLQRGLALGRAGLVSRYQTRGGGVVRALVYVWFSKVVVGGVIWLPPLHPSFLFLCFLGGRILW